MIPGCYDPRERAKDLISNGILASVAFPTLPGFAGRKFQTFANKELALLCVRAWNDFILEEWCAAEPELFVRMTIAPVWDVSLAVAETERALARGTKALCWIEDPANLGLPGYHTHYWDTLFALCEQGTTTGVHAHRRRHAGSIAGRTSPDGRDRGGLFPGSSIVGQHDGQPYTS